MPLLENKKVRCPLCGAKNPVDAPRCTICTRPLQGNSLPTQAVYEEALWSTRIASKGARTKVNPYAVLGLLVVAAVILNYFVIGLGPSWAHEQAEAPLGADWKVYRDQPDYAVDLPGSPIIGRADAQGTELTTATVWVGSRWQRIRDDDTRSVGALEEARVGVHAALVTAVGPAPGDPAASLTAVVQSMVGGTQLEPGGITTVQDPPAGQQRLVLLTNHTGFPEPNDRGVVRATAIVAGGRIWIAASFVRGGDDAALHEHLVEHFVPTIG